MVNKLFYKNILVRGNPNNNGAVIIKETAGTSYVIRCRAINNVTFKDITFIANTKNVFVNESSLYGGANSCLTIENCVLSSIARSCVSSSSNTYKTRVEVIGSELYSDGFYPIYNEGNQELFIDNCKIVMNGLIYRTIEIRDNNDTWNYIYDSEIIA